MGLLHVYYGQGKGKTTAAMGLALRALGSDMPVVVAQFLKNTPSGEIGMLQKLDVPIFRGQAGQGFSFTMTDAQRQQTRRIHEENFEAAWARCADAQPCLLVLDEMLGALETDLFPQQRLLDALDARGKGLEVVLTGRVLTPELAQRADYITEMRCVRHPFDRGQQARRGIEF